jgi:hypothetical protein
MGAGTSKRARNNELPTPAVPVIVPALVMIGFTTNPRSIFWVTRSFATAVGPEKPENPEYPLNPEYPEYPDLPENPEYPDIAPATNHVSVACLIRTTLEYCPEVVETP